MEGAASLTAVAPPEVIGKVRNFTAQLEGATSLTAVAPSIFLAWPFRRKGFRRIDGRLAAWTKKKKGEPIARFALLAIGGLTP